MANQFEKMKKEEITQKRDKLSESLVKEGWTVRDIATLFNIYYSALKKPYTQLFLVGGDGFESKGRVYCPICNYQYTHTKTPIDCDSNEGKCWAGRGGVVKIPFYCEDGHEWNFCFGQHKGETHSFYEHI